MKQACNALLEAVQIQIINNPVEMEVIKVSTQTKLLDQLLLEQAPFLSDWKYIFELSIKNMFDTNFSEAEAVSIPSAS